MAGALALAHQRHAAAADVLHPEPGAEAVTQSGADGGVAGRLRDRGSPPHGDFDDHDAGDGTGPATAIAVADHAGVGFGASTNVPG